MIGSRLGHYEVLEKLGQGGMGEVYRARDTRLDRDVALKILPAADADPERSARFEREARAVASLRHPNIVTVHDVGLQDGLRYLAMELVEGETLTKRIPRDGLHLERFLEIAIPLCDAVASAHAKGITHRDLKPDNVMIEADGRVKVLDFGLAKLVDQGPVQEATVTSAPHATQQGSILGTVSYMSPEQAEGKPVDARSDVFSLGIVLYEMITGARPFQGTNSISTLTAILRDPAMPIHERKPTASKALDRIVRRCLAKKPEERYPDAGGLRDDLRGLAAGAPSRARGRAPLAIGVGVLVLAVVGVAGYLGRDRSAPAAGAEGPRRIVVFPFENLGSAADAYFAAGIADEITSRLSALKELDVLSRTSAMQYDRQGRTMPQIAEDLGVDYVLDGTVRWARDASGKSAVRVTPQLVRAREDRQIWSSSYDRSMEQIFTIQSEIAGEVVGRLGVALGGREREALEAIPTSDVEAYHAYLRAHTVVASTVFAREAWERAVSELEEACERDPRFLRAFSDLAQAHAAFVHFAWDRSEERLARAKHAAERALELDPDSPWAQLALGYYRYWGLKDYDPAYEAFTKAQAGLPSSVEAINGMAFVRRRQGRYPEAADLMQRSIALDPRNALTQFTRGETLTILRRYDDARKSLEQAIALDPNTTSQSAALARASLLAGDASGACASVRAMAGTSGTTETRQIGFWTAIGCRDWDLAWRLTENLPEAANAQFQFECRSAARGWVSRFRGDPAAARVAFERAKQVLLDYGKDHPPDSNHASLLGMVLAELGEKDAALDAARLALTLRPASNDAWLLQHRKFDLALVEIAVGDRAAGLGYLRELLREPSDQVSPAFLRLSPVFDPLRGDPEFERLAGDASRP